MVARPRLFGTDGIRGVANRDLTPELVLQVGSALVATLGREGVYLIGRDTRLSGEMLEGALIAGICAAGGDVDRAGILPTPAVALLTRRLARPCGIVLSASHNPIEDNGIKLFGPDGFKFPDEVEERIEAAVGSDRERPVGTGIGQAATWPRRRTSTSTPSWDSGCAPRPGCAWPWTAPMEPPTAWRPASGRRSGPP